MTEYFLCLVLFGLGFYAVVVKRNIIKIIIGVAIMDYAVNLFFVMFGYRAGSDVPILSKEIPVAGPMVDPLAQAIVLTTIVIGLAITIILAGTAMRLYEKYGTLDITQYRKLKG
jgi:multicomponent Na+:H+ antiporter subunit C